MSDIERRKSDRRASDEALELLKTHIAKDEAIQSEISATQAEILNKLTDMHEMLKVFNSIKGFWFTCKWIGVVSIGIAAAAGAMTAIGYAIKAWVKS